MRGCMRDVRMECIVCRRELRVLLLLLRLLWLMLMLKMLRLVLLTSMSRMAPAEESLWLMQARS